MMKYPHIQVDIYEEGRPYPAVSHIFYGKSQKEAQGYLNAHVGTDSFLRAAIKTGKYQDMNLRVEIFYG